MTKLRAAQVSDALDSLGLRAQSLRAGIVPLTPGTAVAGPAFPLKVTVVDAQIGRAHV